MTIYAPCAPRPATLPKPINNGPSAPPAIPIISKPDAVPVKRPKPAKASGQIAGQTIALAKPNNAMHKRGSGNSGPPNGTNNKFEIMNESLLPSTTSNTVIIPAIPDINNAVCWLIKRGIVKIPIA